MNIAILAILILLNGIFAMAEIALVTARKNRLKKMSEEGSKAAATAIQLGEEPTNFLSTIQIGITAIGVLNGIVGEAALAGPLSEILQGLGLEAGTSHTAATAIIVAGITYVTIVIGELVPKRIAQFNAEGIARFMARPIMILSKLSKPFVVVLAFSTDSILRLIGRSDISSSNLTEEDIEAILDEGSQTGVIEKEEHDMVRKVFQLEDRNIASLMTPRSEIVYLDLDQDFETSLSFIINTDHARFPVCRGGMQNLLGVITAKRLFRLYLQGKDADIYDYMLPCVFVPEWQTGMKLMEQFRESGIQMVFVVDEYGAILGLITIQDMLEALAGEFKSGDPADMWAVEREDGSWLMDGLIPIPELKEKLGLKTVPEGPKVKFNTLSGMIMWLVGGLPKTGNTVVWESFRFEVVDVDGNRVDKVLVSRLPLTDEEPVI